MCRIFGIIDLYSIYVNDVDLEGDIKKKRSYHSPRRREQAEATRRKILGSARQLFSVHGYAATTLPMIAEAAQVSLPTVTASFGTKYGLLDALISTTVRGDDAPDPLVARAWWHAMLEESDPAQQLVECGKIFRSIHERTTDIFEIVRGAATADKQLAEKMDSLGKGRLGDMHTIAQALAEKKALKPDMDVKRAADILWVLGSAHVYRLAVVDRGWSPSDYETWIAQTLIESLLK